MRRQHLHEFFSQHEISHLCLALAERANRQFTVANQHHCAVSRKEAMELEGLRKRIRSMTKTYEKQSKNTKTTANAHGVPQ
jgi:hypothetical protein